MPYFLNRATARNRLLKKNANKLNFIIVYSCNLSYRTGRGDGDDNLEEKTKTVSIENLSRVSNLKKIQLKSMSLSEVCHIFGTLEQTRYFPKFRSPYSV